MELPIVISKSWLELYFQRSFRWVRRNLLTDAVITEELEFDLKTFNRWKDFPPSAGNRLIKWMIEKEHLNAEVKKETWQEHIAHLKKPA